ncbi:MAG: hypothetical protein ABI158_11605 [Edaphobacter sp.]
MALIVLRYRGGGRITNQVGLDAICTFRCERAVRLSFTSVEMRSG